MHLTFAQAYAIVCPDGGAVVPHSKQYSDIMELMRQSGYKHYTETVVQDSAPKIPKTVVEASRFMETPQVMEKPLYISRRQWMSVDANKQAFLKALNKNKTTS
jgi:N-acetylmuramoyl-L-alanine amidase CwlA